MIALEWKRAKRRMSKLGLGIISWFRLVCIGGRLMTTQLRICVLTISLVCKISTYRCNLNRRRVCSLEWVYECYCVSWVLISILLGVQKFKCGGIWSVHFDAHSFMFVLMHFYGLVCLFFYFMMFLYFSLFLAIFDFRILFSALAVFTKKFITGATGIGLTHSKMHWKAKRKSYKFCVEAKSWFGM